MKLTGVEVPVETLDNVDPDTVLIVISDENGGIRVVKVDHDSIPASESFLRVTANASNPGQPQAGCWVLVSGKMVWMDPCPY
ncbi:MAG: hypothetical protein IPL59_01405 [Candidatus Competibacteraceae bacterium]|nr:hypothetical protein [Candidatus Competibacteraceae bacterium]MBK8751269.1 hypothetical protein [Candidatus Competibacteraceae bacterium]